MKIRKRQTEEIEITIPWEENTNMLDRLKEMGYTIMRVRPRIKKNGWSVDITQYEIHARKPVNKWKRSTNL